MNRPLSPAPAREHSAIRRRVTSGGTALCSVSGGSSHTNTASPERIECGAARLGDSSRTHRNASSTCAVVVSSGSGAAAAAWAAAPGALVRSSSSLLWPRTMARALSCSFSRRSCCSRATRAATCAAGASSPALSSLSSVANSFSSTAAMPALTSASSAFTRTRTSARGAGAAPLERCTRRPGGALPPIGCCAESDTCGRRT